MTASTQLLTERPAWKALGSHHQQVRGFTFSEAVRG